MSNTLWAGRTSEKLYLQSGEFSSTIKRSTSYAAKVTVLEGVSHDITATYFCDDLGSAPKLFRTSGFFGTTISNSLGLSPGSNGPSGISYSADDILWCDLVDGKLFLQSGRFTTTIKNSLSVGNIPNGISFDGTNTPWCEEDFSKLLLQSGKFVSTIKTSLDISAIELTPSGISFNGTNTPVCGNTDDKLYLFSGQFSSTLKASLDISAIDNSPSGIEHESIISRLSISSSLSKQLVYDYLRSGPNNVRIIYNPYSRDSVRIDWSEFVPPSTYVGDFFYGIYVDGEPYTTDLDSGQTWYDITGITNLESIIIDVVIQTEFGQRFTFAYDTIGDRIKTTFLESATPSSSIARYVFFRSSTPGGAVDFTKEIGEIIVSDRLDVKNTDFVPEGS